MRGPVSPWGFINFKGNLMFCKMPMFTFGERLIDYLQAYECFLGALGLESSFMSFAVGRFCPTPEAADLIVLDLLGQLAKA